MKEEIMKSVKDNTNEVKKVENKIFEWRIYENVNDNYDKTRIEKWNRQEDKKENKR